MHRGADMQPVVLDTETTGLDDNAEVIQIGILGLDGTVLMNTLVQCQGDIPDDAIEIHGITKAMLSDAPTWPEIHDSVVNLLQGAEYTVIYNARFDVRLMRQTAARYGLELPPYPTKCAMYQFAQRHNDGQRIKLTEAACWMGVDISEMQAHSAIDDCEMTRRLWLKLEHEELRRKKRRERREKWKNLVMELVPSDVSSYPYYGQTNRPAGFKTFSQIRRCDLENYQFAGVCCDAFGNRGYLFEPKTN